MELITLFLILVVFVTIAVKIVAQYSCRDSKFNLPPALPYLPIIGNIHYMKGKQPHKLFHDISKRIGPVITFWFGKKAVIVVNEINVAKEALLKQDSVFAGRPQRYTGKLYSRIFKGVIVADYGEDWRKTRKLAHQALKTYGMEQMKTEELITTECKDLIKRLRKQMLQNDVIDISKDIGLSVLNVICSLCFGNRYEPHDREFLRIVEANAWFVEGITCSAVIDSFPCLAYLPYRKLQLLTKYIKVRDEILDRKFKEHEKTFDGDNLRDIIDYMIDNERKEKNDGDQSNRDNQIVLISDLFIAGSDTTTTALLWAFLYLSKWPKKQERLHKELDAVIGTKQPTIMDKNKLPYLQATICEVLRLSSLTPLGVPRKAMEATSLGGYDIPKNTTVIFNMYAMNHDERIWKQAYEFQPERFLDENGQFHTSRVNFIPFSAGKRNCLGERLAKLELFLILTQLLQSFSFGSVEDLDVEGISGATLKPRPFKLRITNRQSPITNRG